MTNGTPKGKPTARKPRRRRKVVSTAGLKAKLDMRERFKQLDIRLSYIEAMLGIDEEEEMKTYQSVHRLSGSDDSNA